MRSLRTILALAALVVASTIEAQQPPRAPRAPMPVADARPARAPVVSAAPFSLLGPDLMWDRERHPQDPADSLYREARSLLNRGEWQKSAVMFSQIARRTPVSDYAADALYWQAFALYRIGSVSELKEGLAALDSRKSRFPKARNTDEADELAIRIGGALVARGDTSASSRLRTAANAATTACDSEELAVRSSALSVLARNNPEAAAPLMIKVLDRRDECSVSLRKSAVMMIGTRGDAAAKSKLTDVAKNDPSTSVRSDAVSYLGKLPGDEIVSVLDGIIRNDESESVQRSAVRALGAHESPRARAAIRSLVERTSASERLRLEAISTFDPGSNGAFSYSYSCDDGDCGFEVMAGAATLASGVAVAPLSVVRPTPPTAPTPAVRSTAPVVMGRAEYESRVDALRGELTYAGVGRGREVRRMSADDAAWLRGVYGRLDNTRLKSRVVFVLSRSADEPALNWLAALVQREDEPADVRATVISRLGRDLPIAQLNRFYDGATNRAVRQQIVSVLGSRDEPEATDKLIDIVRNGTDPQLRRSAISALNNKKDPRTTQLLLELIDR